MVDIGDIAVKIAGRDAGQICAVINVKDKKYVIIEGNTRRKKCNIEHLEFLGKKIKIKKDAAREDVLNGLKESGLKFKELKKEKPKERKEKLLKSRILKTKPETKEIKPKIVKVKTKKSK